jgi:hypothetical protein
MNIHDFLAKERLKLAWKLLPGAKKAAIQPMIDAAHEQFRMYATTGEATHLPGVPHQLLLAKTALTDDQDDLLKSLPPPQAEAAEIAVGPDGAIWGTGKYQQLDPGWVESAAVWIENLILGKHGFPAGAPAILPMPDQVTIAMAGDWGTGNFGAGPAPAIKIKDVIPHSNPAYTIHLGDVYYAGTKGQESDFLVKLWPAGAAGAFALNSNHEMYSGAKPYFNEAVGSALFHLQNPYSFFALENANWIVVGLDSAYFSDDLKAYLDGSIGNGEQVAFLREVGSRGKKVIVLTHHNGISEDGQTPTALWNEVMSAFPAGTAPAYWYWGHVHAGIAYVPQANGTLCRCTGHSALPWGLASELENNSDVVWFETRNAGDPENPLRVLNGYTVVQLFGADLTETYYDENGQVAWTPARPAIAAG